MGVIKADARSLDTIAQTTPALNFLAKSTRTTVLLLAVLSEALAVVVVALAVCLR